MQICKIDNNSPNFGMRCPAKIKKKIADCLPSDASIRLFKDHIKLANSIKEIGSDNTSLEKFSIRRLFVDDFFDGVTEMWDECRLLFKMTNSKGKKEKVTAKIRSNISGEPLANIYEDFVKVTKMAEEEFLSISLEKSAKKGRLLNDTEKFKTLYPERSEFIQKISNNLSWEYDEKVNHNIISRIFAFIFK